MDRYAGENAIYDCMPLNSELSTNVPAAHTLQDVDVTTQSKQTFIPLSNSFIIFMRLSFSFI